MDNKIIMEKITVKEFLNKKIDEEFVRGNKIALFCIAEDMAFFPIEEIYVEDGEVELKNLEYDKSITLESTDIIYMTDDLSIYKGWDDDEYDFTDEDLAQLEYDEDPTAFDEEEEEDVDYME